ncbi:hypothetical protein M405DRAFT_824870 [Rhizopogon salebrosus TDB-379]|nr:hypothetical protein M405DRAFT_824870 [Rhizopogon salebrosus TDB-379]
MVFYFHYAVCLIFYASGFTGFATTMRDYTGSPLSLKRSWPKSEAIERFSDSVTLTRPRLDTNTRHSLVRLVGGAAQVFS